MSASPALPRRRFIFLAAAAAAAPLTAAAEQTAVTSASAVPPSFPHQDPQVVREVVGASHGNFDRVRELVDARPALARATWDWGFGDWESALGAAAHTGNRDIAEYLIDHGARPSLFSAAMLGHLEVVRAFCTVQPGVQSIPGPHGISLLAHARAGGEPAAAVAQYLEAIGGADGPMQAVPLDAEMQRRLHGDYAYGVEQNQRLTVDDHRLGFLQIRRGDDSPRGLRHLGDAVFYPVGAAEVRLRFQFSGERVLSVTIDDGDLRVVAERLG